MESLPFVFMILIHLYQFASSESPMKCYKCDSFYDVGCNDPFNRTNNVPVEHCMNYCTKFAQAFKPKEVQILKERGIKGIPSFRIKRGCDSDLDIRMSINRVCQRESNRNGGHIYKITDEKYQPIYDWPWDVTIKFAGKTICGGAIVHEQLIMTSISCKDWFIQDRICTNALGGVCFLFLPCRLPLVNMPKETSDLHPVCLNLKPERDNTVDKCFIQPWTDSRYKSMIVPHNYAIEIQTFYTCKKDSEGKNLTRLNEIHCFKYKGYSKLVEHSDQASPIYCSYKTQPNIWNLIGLAVPSRHTYQHFFTIADIHSVPINFLIQFYRVNKRSLNAAKCKI
ncbi:hypothetical protein SNEBB_002065 [Seison nebaliae]|nr:hypothetical protein SNEBB_002065 [Seison nebaliae]